MRSSPEVSDSRNILEQIIMNLTSLSFFLCFIGSLCIYYILPKKFRNAALLAYSAVYFFAASQNRTILYLIVSIVATCAAAHGIQQQNLRVQTADAPDTPVKNSAGRWLAAGLLINLGILTLLKYTPFFAQIAEGIARLFGKEVTVPSLSLAAPAGISFYTLTLCAYLIDIYWKNAQPWSGSMPVSAGRTALMAAYWPLMTSGPIIRKTEIEGDLLSDRPFDWNNVTFGLQRMLWGIFKKIVISVRIGMLVDIIFMTYGLYRGFYVLLAALLYMMQLYTDFSGCMDIVIGASECFGIRLPENFRTPFFARTVQEYWQRWHITLGAFLKDYIMYPLLRSRLIRSFTKWTKAHLGKNASKTLPTYLCMLAVWLLIGLWHGGDWKYVLGMGLWFWFAIILEQNVIKFVKKHFPGKEKSDAAPRLSAGKLLGRVISFLWVYLAASFGNLFFRLDSIAHVRGVLKSLFSEWNPEILWNGSLYEIGVNKYDVRLIPLLLLIVLVVDLLSEKKDVRERLAGGNIVLRWGIFLLLLWGITVFGVYGPGYDAASFIYGNF